MGISKTFTFLLVAMFIASFVIPSHATVKAQTKTIIVPDDYPTIQEAMTHTQIGGTIFVKSGTYHIPPFSNIGFPMSLIGQNPNDTILDGGNNDPSNPNNQYTFQINSPDVTISGFKIQDCEIAFNVVNFNSEPIPSRFKIIGNNLVDNDIAILVQRSDNFEITNNQIMNNSGEGIDIDTSPLASNGIISGNVISQNPEGISVYSQNLTISNNTILNNQEGLNLEWNGSYKVFGNRIHNNSIYGISFGAYVSNTTIYDNDISSNAIGIKLENFAVAKGTSAPAFGAGNIIYDNNFLNNQKNAFVEHSIQYYSPPIANGTDIVSWDNGAVGNYWSDYNGGGTYRIDQKNFDHHPLAEPVNISAIAPSPTPAVPEFPTPVLIITFFVVSTLLGTIAVKRKQTQKNV